ncbi:MAG: NfeD-like protein [Prochlorothrix sp.]
MIPLYLCTFVIGGFFVALAAFGGLDGPDFDIDFEVDLLGREANSAPSSPAATLFDRFNALIPITSARFWTLAAFIFGLSGLAFSFLTGISPIEVLAIAVILALLIGGGGANFLRWLGRDNSDSLVRSEDFVGAAAVVELPFEGNSRGKIKLELRGTYLYYPARSSEARVFEVGDPVLVVGLEEGIAWVVSEERIDRSVLVGSSARVTVPFDRQSTGRIQVEVEGTWLSLQATTELDQEFVQDDRVVILDLQPDCAVVGLESDP